MKNTSSENIYWSFQLTVQTDWDAGCFDPNLLVDPQVKTVSTHRHELDVLFFGLQVFTVYHEKMHRNASSMFKLIRHPYLQSYFSPVHLLFRSPLKGFNRWSSARMGFMSWENQKNMNPTNCGFKSLVVSTISTSRNRNNNEKNARQIQGHDQCPMGPTTSTPDQCPGKRFSKHLLPMHPHPKPEAIFAWKNSTKATSNCHIKGSTSLLQGCWTLSHPDNTLWQ